VKDNRPTNLSLGNLIRFFPVPALASILHRATGIILLVGLAFLLWALYLSLESQAGFDQVAAVMAHPFAKFITWGIVSSILYHLVAGVKHLIMDTGLGETLQGGRIMATATLIISALLIIGAGVWFYAS